MIFGQWYGSFEIGELIINIDESRNYGSLLFLAYNGSPSCLTKVSFRQEQARLIGSLSDFLWFTAQGVMPLSEVQARNLPVIGNVNFSFQFGNQSSLQGQLTISKTSNFEAGKINLNKDSSGPPVSKKISWEQFKQILPTYSNEFVFRGQKISSDALRTSFHRKNCWDLRRYFYEGPIDPLIDHLGFLANIKFKTSDPEDLLAGLHLAQHHGFPTPLLDWSHSPYVAAFFAFNFLNEERRKRESVRIYAFNQERWFSEMPQYSSGALLAPGVVIRSVKPVSAGNHRAVVQNACSLFSNIDDIYGVVNFLAEQNNKEKYISYFDIYSDQEDIALKDLERMGITELKLFPDLDHACGVAKRNYFQGS